MFHLFIFLSFYLLLSFFISFFSLFCYGLFCFAPLSFTLIISFFLFILLAGLGGSVGCASDWRPGGRGFDPRQVTFFRGD